MKRLAAVLTVVAVAGVAGAMAVQSTLAQVGLTATSIEKWAVDDLVWDTTVNAPSFGGTVRDLVKKLPPEQRAALVREAASLTKSFLMSAAFQKAYTAKIKEAHRAVDHGIDPDTYGQNAPVDPVAIAAVSTVNMMRTAFPHEQLKAAFDQQRQELPEKIKEETGDERAKAQKYLARLNAIAPLATSNREEFKKQYTLAMSAYIGGPDTEEKIQAFNASDADRQRIVSEQREWNKWNLNGILKRKLTYFVAQASQVDTVDFKAVTRPDQDKGLVFVNPDYESKNKSWKAIYRVGRAPTVAALDFAKAWLKELK
jgi:hypothetical protein